MSDYLSESLKIAEAELLTDMQLDCKLSWGLNTVEEVTYSLDEKRLYKGMLL